MKKTIALILCLFMLVTALPVVGLAADEEEKPEATVFPVEAYCKDTVSISLEEARVATKRYSTFSLHKSVKNFEPVVKLTDGGEHKLDGTNPLEIYYEVWCDELEEGNCSSNFESYEAYLKYVEETHKKIKEENDGRAVAYGEAYIKGSEADSARIKGAKTIMVYASFRIYEYDSAIQRYVQTGSETLNFQKECVPYYSKITPVSGMPQYRCEEAESLDFSDAVFEIEYYGEAPKQEKVVYTGHHNKKQYELDGNPLTYTVGRGNSRSVLISFYDTEYVYETPEFREYPFSDVEIDDCVFEGSRLTEISYTVTYKDKAKETYTRQVMGNKDDPNGEYIDFIGDYFVRVHESRYSDRTSIVSLDVEGISDYTFCAHISGEFFPDLIAKIAAVFQEFIYRFRVWFRDIYY